MVERQAETNRKKVFKALSIFLTFKTLLIMEMATESHIYLGGIFMLKGYYTRKDTRFGFFKEDLKITLATYAVMAAGYYVWTKIEEKKTNEKQEVTEAEFETKEGDDTL